MPTMLDGVKHQSLPQMPVTGTWTGEDCAYAAGIIDGEGCITIKRGKPQAEGRQPTYDPVVAVAMSDFEAVDWLKHTFGGYIYDYPQLGKGDRLMRRWCLSGIRCQQFLKLVLPYLKVKRLQAAVVVNFPCRGRSGRRGRSQEVIDAQEHYYWLVRQLKLPEPEGKF